jgi:hypothetical protein
MRVFRLLILLIFLPLFIFTCSRNDDGDFVPDLTKNVFYIDNNEYLLSDGFIEYAGTNNPRSPFRSIFTISLYSSCISYDTSYHGGFQGLQGIGDMIIMEAITDAWDRPDTGTYSTDCNEGEIGYMELMGFVDFETEEFDAYRSYEFLPVQ